MAARVPATVITGFLGAGKTTLLRHILTNAGGKKLAVIVNEFGELGIDGSLIAAGSTKEDDVIELANGCVCCTVADEFLPAMLKLLHRADPPEHILIETSGLALPKPLIKAFDWPGIRMRATVDGVIVVVDSPSAMEHVEAEHHHHHHHGHHGETKNEETGEDGHDNPAAEVFADQLACADLVLLNKTDQISPHDLEHLSEHLRERLRPGVKLVPTRHGAADVRALLGIGAAAEDDLAARPSAHDDSDDHEHDEFESFSVPIPEVAEPDAMVERVRAVIAEHGILRLKGFLAIGDRDMRYVLQAVGDRINGYYDRPWKPGEKHEGRVVVIGFHGLDQDKIAKALAG